MWPGRKKKRGICKTGEQRPEQRCTQTTYDILEEALTDAGEVPPARSADSLVLPLLVALSLLPDAVVVKPIPQDLRDQVVEIDIPGFQQQLALGSIHLKVAALAYYIPAHLLMRSAFEDYETEITIPRRIIEHALASS